MVNKIKRAPNGKDGGGRKKATASIIVMEENTNGNAVTEAMEKAAEVKPTSF